MFQTDTLQDMITNINSNLNQENTRYNGLFILDTVLDQCSKNVFSKHGSLWITKAIQVLENVHSNVRDLTLACKVLGSLIRECKEIPDLNKQISMHNVKQLVNALSALQTDAKCGAVYYLLAVLLYHYPEVCEKFQMQIKKMILSQIDAAQDNLINASAKCYVLLSKATERTFKPPPEKSVYTCSTYDEALLCNSLHAIMDTLFSELTELESVDIWDQLELPCISEKYYSVVQFYNLHKQRFSNLCTFLSSMLRGYQATNSVMPDDILKVLCRGLAVTPLNLTNTTFKEQMLHTILPELHISLLSVLDAFIIGFAQELIPFGGKILLLFQQILQWTSIALDNKISISNTKLFTSVRMHTYTCLSLWLKTTGSLSGINTVINEYIIHILRDIIPEQIRILLTVQQQTPHSSKRAVKRFKSSQYENSSILNNEATSAKNESLDKDLCKEALVALQNILSSDNILLKTTFYKNVQNSVIPLLHTLCLNASSDKDFYKTHSQCRLELFKVLRALQLNPHITLAFPIQYCLEISHMATHDIDLTIAQEARFALAELEKIIHPAAPTLRLHHKSDKTMDADEPETNNTCVEIHNVVRTSEEPEIEGVFGQEQEKTQCTEENHSNVEEPMDVTIESRAECELPIRVNIEEQEQDKQPKDVPRINQIDETIEKAPDFLEPIIIDEEKDLLQNNVKGQEKEDTKEVDYQTLFCDSIK